MGRAQDLSASGRFSRAGDGNLQSSTKAGTIPSSEQHVIDITQNTSFNGDYPKHQSAINAIYLTPVKKLDIRGFDNEVSRSQLANLAKRNRSLS